MVARLAALFPNSDGGTSSRIPAPNLTIRCPDFITSYATT
jgi:hypothetical protein